MSDLFSGGAERLALPGADVSYRSAIDLGAQPERLLERLIAETPWRQDDVRVWGKTYRQPRLVAWHGDPGKVYGYAGVMLDPLPWTDLLLDLRRRVEAGCGTAFNSVLLNYYRDQNDSMGLHSDDEAELGPRPTIASVSLGAERPLVFKSRLDRAASPVRIVLGSGSLLLMRGDTQRLYKHGIAKARAPLGPRVNLTFRTIMDVPSQRPVELQP